MQTVPDAFFSEAPPVREIASHSLRLGADSQRALDAAFSQFRAIRKDAVDNQTALATKLPMPVLAIGGEKSFGATEAVVMRNAATDVTELVMPNAGHWLMEEATQPTIDAVRRFLEQK